MADSNSSSVSGGLQCLALWSLRACSTVSWAKAGSHHGKCH